MGYLATLALATGAGMFYSAVLLAAALHPAVLWKTHVSPVLDWSTLGQVSAPQFILAAAALLYFNLRGMGVDRDEKETRVIWALRGGSCGAFVCGIAYLGSGYVVLYLFEAALQIEIAFATAGYFAARLFVGAKGAR